MTTSICINTAHATNTVIVVVGPRCWGSGKSLQQAVAIARKNYAAAGHMEYNAYVCSPDFCVDDMGVLHAKSVTPLCEIRYAGEMKVATYPDGRAVKKGAKV